MQRISLAKNNGAATFLLAGFTALLLLAAFNLKRVNASTHPSAPTYQLSVQDVQSSLSGQNSNVPVDAHLAIRFPKPQPDSIINERAITLFGPLGAIETNVEASEGGLLAVLTPRQQLLPGSRHTLFIEGSSDPKSPNSNLTTLGFRTQTLNPAAAKAGITVASAYSPVTDATTGATALVNADSKYADVTPPSTTDTPLVLSAPLNLKTAKPDDEVFTPEQKHAGGHWRTGKPFTQAMEHYTNTLVARKGPLAFEHTFKPPQKTALPTNVHAATDGNFPADGSISGYVLRINDLPLAHATLSVGDLSTRTDAQGYFQLDGIEPGRRILYVNGSGARQKNVEYARFSIGVDVQPGQKTEIPPVYLPRIHDEDWIDIPSPAPKALIITHPSIPGLELHLAKGSVLRDREGKILTHIALVPLPLDRAPFPFSENAPVYLSLQPGGLRVYGVNGINKGITVVYPNLTGALPNTRSDFWRYDPLEKGWYIYGQGTVSADARRIVPDPGVELFDSNGFMGGVSYVSINSTSLPLKATPANDCSCIGDPVSSASGLFLHTVTDSQLPDVMPISFTRSYQSADTILRAFGYGSTHSYEAYLYFPISQYLGLNTPTAYQNIKLVLPGGTQLDFVRTQGSVKTDSVLIYTGADPDYYAARLSYNAGNARWILKRKDGFTQEFADYSGYPLLAQQDRYGNAVQLIRIGGRITQIVSSHGRTLDISYNPQNLITQIVDQSGRKTLYQYNSSLRLSTVTDPLGQTQQYSYDSSGRMTSVKDPRGTLMVVNQYDNQGRVSLQTYPDGSTYQFAYTADSTGHITQVNATDERGTVEQMLFNAAGYVTSATKAYGTAHAQTTTYQYQTGTNLLTGSTDPLGRVSQFGYDAKGNLTGVTRMAGTPNQATWSIGYEPLFNKPNQYTDPLGHVTNLSYDTHGNLLQMTGPLGNVTTFTYNSAGQKLSASQTLAGQTLTTTYTYSNGLLASKTDPQGRTTTYQNDSAGRQTAVTDPLGGLNSIAYDPLDRIISTTDPLNRILQNTYDGNGNLTVFTDASGMGTDYSYDARNRLIARTDPLNQTESISYDAAGDPVSLTDRQNQTTQRSYDNLGRLSQSTYADGSSTSYTYDLGNRLTQMQDYAANGALSQTITRSYDGNNRLLQEQSNQGTVNYSYDLLGQRTSMTVAGQPIVQYSYDANGQLTQINQGTQQVGLSYDELGRRQQLTLPNGVSVNYDFDDVNQLTCMTYTKADNTPLGNLSYSYDNAGRRTGQGGSLATSLLPTATVNNATHDAANRLIAWNGEALSHDPNGNLTNDGAYTYLWDARQRLSAIQQGASSVASFQYDPFGRRIQKTVNGITTRYLYDGWQIVQEQNADGTPKANLLTGLGLDELYSRTQGGTSSYYLTDALGSVLALTDNTGNLSTTYRYDPYGNTTSAGLPSSNPFQYTSRENDGTGLYYYRHRYYSPGLQRFISEDPIGLAGGQANFYAYVGNNPLRWVDPLGLGPWDKLYGWPREFWKWFHELDNGKTMKELKDPATKQVPKEDAKPYYDEWKNGQGGWIAPSLLPELLLPWWLTPSATGGCDAYGNCSDMVRPQQNGPCP